MVAESCSKLPKGIQEWVALGKFLCPHSRVPIAPTFAIGSPSSTRTPKSEWSQRRRPGFLCVQPQRGRTTQPRASDEGAQPWGKAGGRSTESARQRMPARAGNCPALSGLVFFVLSTQGGTPSSLALDWVVPPRWGWTQRQSGRLRCAHSDFGVRVQLHSTKGAREWGQRNFLRATPSLVPIPVSASKVWNMILYASGGDRTPLFRTQKGALQNHGYRIILKSRGEF